MQLNKIYNEDCLKTMARMPDGFADCVITSPPYWQLRDYNHPDQWGLEPTVDEYLEHLWGFMDKLWRVLKPGGTVWFNLGDTYNVKNKCLLLIPHRFAIGCMDRGWIVRNDIIWAKRNGMPESATDRFSKKHEYMFFMVKQSKYYFDLDIVREKILFPPDGRHFGNNQSSGKEIRGEWKPKTKIPKDNAETFGSPRARQHQNIEGNMTKDGLTRTTAGLNMKSAEEKVNELGKNPGSVCDFWDIPTKPSPNKHYASYNIDLITKPILAGCPKHGIIYDPFMGTGSTAEAAIRSDRKFIGSEISKEYCDIAEKRLKPYLQQTTMNF